MIDGFVGRQAVRLTGGMTGVFTFIRRWRRIAAAAVALSVTSPAIAQDETGFQAYLQQVRGRALAAGVRPATLDAVLPTLTLKA